MITMYIVSKLSPFNLILREGEDGSEWPPSRRPGQGWKGSRSRMWKVSSAASPGHFWKERNEARNPKLDMVWCTATLGLEVKTRTSNKRQ